MITRYAMSWATDEDEFVYVSPIESDKGNWVKWEDYAHLQQERVHDLNQIGGLQQELARLRASSFVTAVPVDHYERVVKAGDVLCFHYISLARKRWPDDPLPSSVKDWIAAKEGKQP